MRYLDPKHCFFFSFEKCCSKELVITFSAPPIKKIHQGVPQRGWVPPSLFGNLKLGSSPSNRREDFGLVGEGAKMASGRFKATV
jgi:hypothetical protein